MNENRENLEGKYVRILGKIIKLKPLIISAKHSSQLEVGDYSILNCKKNEITVCDRNQNGYGVTIKIDEVKESPRELVEKLDLVEVSGHVIRVINIVNDIVSDSHWKEYDIAKITKILTPKGKDLIFQWEEK